MSLSFAPDEVMLSGRFPRFLRFTHQLLLIVAALIIVASLGSLVALARFDQRVEKFTLGLRPAQFLGFDEDDILANHTDIFGVGHNSGDTIGTAVQALIHGADVVEIDVVMDGGQLYAGHNVPNRIFGQTSFRGPPLDQAWVIAAGAGAVQLDLKSSSAAYLNLVQNFLSTRQRFPALVLSSNDPAVLSAMREVAPNAVLLYSTGGPQVLATLQNDPETIALIDGVSIREDLVDEESIGWLHDAELQVWAWTVNQPERAAELAALGVDALTTDNLAILTALAGGGPDDRRVERRLVPTEEPTEDEGESAADRPGNQQRPT